MRNYHHLSTWIDGRETSASIGTCEKWGLTVAARLRRAGESDVAIIEPSEKHFYQPLWTLVGAGAVRSDATARSECDYIAAGVTWIKESSSTPAGYGSRNGRALLADLPDEIEQRAGRARPAG